jgi:hypothetical protein
MTYVDPGTTFGAANATLTSSGLHTLIEGSTWTAIAYPAEWNSSVRLVKPSATEPASPREGDIWYDTVNKYMRPYSGGFDVPGVGPFMYNGGAATLFTGSPAVKTDDGNYSFQQAAASGDEHVLGCVQKIVNPGATAVVRRTGLGLVLVEGPCQPGDQLVTKASGNARSARVLYGGGSSGTFTMGRSFAMIFTDVAAGVTATVTCLIFGG